MLSHIFFLVALVASSVTTAKADSDAQKLPEVDSHRFGIGLIEQFGQYRANLGAATAISAKYWLSDMTAINFEVYAPPLGDIGLWGPPQGMFGLNADYLLHLKPGKSIWNPYMGLGMILNHSEDTKIYAANGTGGFDTTSISSWKIGLRMPIGVETPLVDKDLNVFVQLVSGIITGPENSTFKETPSSIIYAFRLDFGVRYYL